MGFVSLQEREKRGLEEDIAITRVEQAYLSFLTFHKPLI